MKSLYITITFCFLLLPLIIVKEKFACSVSEPLYTHFVYMFAHASLIHWLCNSWSLLVFHNLFRPSRLCAAYILSVLVSFIPLSAKPVIGLSVIVCFFLGFAARYLYHRNRLGMVLTLVILILSCFLPEIAALYHITMFILGFLYYPVECFFKRINNYMNE